MPRERELQLKFHVNEQEKEQIKKLVEKSNLSQSDFLRKCALNKKIYVIDGVKDLTVELKKIGNNLNQLTRLAHEGKVNCDRELREINGEMKELWQLLRQLIQKAH